MESGTRDGDSLRTGKKEKKKSFLVTYFPKLPLAPVPPAWTAPLPPPQHPSSEQQLAQRHPVLHGLSGSAFGAAGSGLSEWELGLRDQWLVGADWLAQTGCLVTFECINELIYQAVSHRREKTLSY